ncbi:MAG: alpha/beta hydrolase [Bacteroidales bacterium]|nr:alpha/beta hydrolase [Bacteroidales bacterium]
MKYESFYWDTPDKKVLFAQCWKPLKESGKTILLIHGLGEHSGRYKHWADLFVKQGYNFLSFDLRGHGKSAGIRGYAKSLEILLDDIDLMLDRAELLFPGSKFVLYGHSMGGNLALNHIIHRNRSVDALIVTSPWLRLVKEPSPVTIAVASVATRLIPQVALPNGLNAEDLSHNQEIVQNYKIDPLNHNKISFRLFHEIYRAGYHALRNVYKINYPFLLMHGTEDKITSPKASENFVMNTSSRTHLKLWDGQYHELHNELIYQEVFDYSFQWLNKHV